MIIEEKRLCRVCGKAFLALKKPQGSRTSIEKHRNKFKQSNMFCCSKKCSLLYGTYFRYVNRKGRQEERERILNLIDGMSERVMQRLESGSSIRVLVSVSKLKRAIKVKKK